MPTNPSEKPTNPYVQQLVESSSVFAANQRVLETYFTDPSFTDNPLLAECLVQLLLLIDQKSRRSQDISAATTIFTLLETYQQAADPSNTDKIETLGQKKNKQLLASIIDHFAQSVLAHGFNRESAAPRLGRKSSGNSV